MTGPLRTKTPSLELNGRWNVGTLEKKGSKKVLFFFNGPALYPLLMARPLREESFFLAASLNIRELIENSSQFNLSIKAGWTWPHSGINENISLRTKVKYRPFYNFLPLSTRLFCQITCTLKRTRVKLFRFKISQFVPLLTKNPQNISKICKK